MAQRRSHTRLILAGIAVALSVLFTPPLFADGGDPTLIHACVKKVNGQVRIVDPNDACLPSESPAHWPASAPGNTAGSIMVHGGSFGVGGAAVNFVHFGGGIPVYRSPRDGVIQNLRILVTANTYDGDTPVTLMVNGVATPVSTVILAGSTGSVDVPGTFAISDGDRISVVLDRGASTVGSLELSVAYEIL
ncbi:MAG TPA: hypothetical protein VGC93_05220 [Thermoanaerobaculia bacterium]